MKKVKRTERGWAGHFCCARDCLFRRNTLLEYEDIKIVVSTVGLMLDPLNKDKYIEIGCNRYYDTMAFHSDLVSLGPEDKKYYDADTSKQVYFDSPWTINKIDADNEANDMHEVVVKEISKELLKGNKYESNE